MDPNTRHQTGIQTAAQRTLRESAIVDRLRAHGADDLAAAFRRRHIVASVNARMRAIWTPRLHHADLCGRKNG